MKKHMTLAERWLWLGVTAIALAGVYALIPVIGRTPQLQDVGIMQQLFDVALAVHVDLSVLVWFLAMLGMGVALLMEPYATRWPYWLNAGFAVTALATVLMALSPLDPEWMTLKSNYIPILKNEMFLLSLGLLVAGLVVTLLPLAVTYLSTERRQQLSMVEQGWLAAATIVAMALCAFALTGNVVSTRLPDLSQRLPGLPPRLSDIQYFEILFWVGGHVLQFAFTMLAMVAWLSLLAALGGTLPARRWAMAAYILTFGGAVTSFSRFALLQHDGSYFQNQTKIMIEFGGLGATLMALLVIPKLVAHGRAAGKARNAYTRSLVMSLILFFTGGVLGLMISGQNVTIPAHYHGMIVGITLALMGLAYSMLPRFGYASVAATRLACWQPIVYGVGQLMHIGGLAYCGGYGILRKTAGGFENLTPDIKIALGIFGLGGMLAILGGLMFVVVMLRARCRASVSPQ